MAAAGAGWLRMEGRGRGVCGVPPPCPALTFPQPLPLCLELPLLPGQLRQATQAGRLQLLQTLFEPGLGLFGHLPLHV